MKCTVVNLVSSTMHICYDIRNDNDCYKEHLLENYTLLGIYTPLKMNF